jgi:hypothetical protein
MPRRPVATGIDRIRRDAASRGLVPEFRAADRRTIARVARQEQHDRTGSGAGSNRDRYDLSTSIGIVAVHCAPVRRRNPLMRRFDSDLICAKSAHPHMSDGWGEKSRQVEECASGIQAGAHRIIEVGWNICCECLIHCRRQSTAGIAPFTIVYPVRKRLP